MGDHSSTIVFLAIMFLIVYGIIVAIKEINQQVKNAQN